MWPSRTFQSIGFTPAAWTRIENFTRLWLRTRRVFVLQDFRSAVVVNSNRFHGLVHCAGRFFPGTSRVCLIIASIVLLITAHWLTVASLVDCEGAKANRNFLGHAS